MLDVLDGEAVRRWCDTSLARLRAAADELNRLNVYPVKDGDTGVNLVTTVAHLCRDLPESGELPDILRAMSRAALMGAHGNSGTILSQLLRGVAEAGDGAVAMSAERLAAGLRRGAELAYKAVSAPVEGTILTVARLAADAAVEAADGGADLPRVATAAADGARTALAHTTEQLQVLSDAGVVDAGGQGWCVMLDALVEVVGIDGAGADRPAPRTEGSAPQPADEPAPVVARAGGVAEAPRESGSAGFGYEVQYLLDADQPAVARLRERLDGLGDSLVVVGGPALWNVHVHVNDVGAAIEAGIDAGRPHRITVTRFADQVASAGAGPAAGGLTAARVLAVVDGPELAALVADAGAEPVPVDGPGGALDRRLLAAIEAGGDDGVALLPNSRAAADAVEAAVVAARAAGRLVAAVPTRSVVQGLAALAVHDSCRPFRDDLVSMASAAAATRTLEVTADGGAFRGSVDDTGAVTGDDPFPVGAELLDRVLIAGGDLVTIVTGEHGADLGERLRAYVAAVRPAIEIQLHHGGSGVAALVVVGVE